MTALFERFLKFFSNCHYRAEIFKVNQQNTVIFKNSNYLSLTSSLKPKLILPAMTVSSHVWSTCQTS